MELRINDLTLIIKFDNINEEKSIKSFLTFKNSKNAFFGGSFHPEKVENVCFLSKVKEYYVCFAGFAKELLIFAKQNNFEIKNFTDKRTHFKFQKKEWTHDELRKYFNPNFKYVEHQIKALDRMLKTNNGIIVAPTSAGKSSIISAYIRATKLPTLILVNKVMLGSQLMDGLREDGIDCGICSGQGIIDGTCMVSTIQSVKKIPYLDSFKALIVDECFPGNTKVLTENGYKSISSLVNNKSTEKVFSFNKKTKKVELKPITNWMKKETEYDTFVKVYFSKTSNNTSTPNHKYYVYDDKNIIMKRADELSIGDKIITYCKDSSKDKSHIPTCIDYKLFDCDKGFYEKNTEEFYNYGYKAITDIKTITPKCKTVYNITVDDNHNYFIGNSLALVSNCHNTSAETFQDFLKQFGCPMKFGFSASPYRTGDFYGYAKIRQFLGSPLVKIESSELIENKVMAKPHLFIVKHTPEKQEYMDYQIAYSEAIVENESRNNIISKIVNKYKTGVFIIVNILEHGEILKKMFPQAVFISGETPLEERKDVVKKFDNEEIPILIGTTILQEGISITHMKVMILACGGKSNVAILQKIGRSLRFKEGEKEEVDYYDFYDNCSILSKHSFTRVSLYKKAGYDDIKILDEDLKEIVKKN